MQPTGVISRQSKEELLHRATLPFYYSPYSCFKSRIMKKIISPVLVVLFTITLAAAQSKETRSVETFNKLSFRVPGKLYLRQGSPQKVELEGSKEFLSEVETK